MANVVDETLKPDTGETLLFVYGTLMRGGKFHSALENSPNVEFLGQAEIRGELYRLRGGEFPGAVSTSRPDRFVHGELYCLRDPDRTLARIDELEGCREGLFKRSFVDVWQNGKEHKAWTYFYCKSVSSAEPLPHGKFLPVHTSAS
jgi:gamma-glutamylcyclotransferase (GGCT)/AIG2-like uncharacterized protein YtfP